MKCGVKEMLFAVAAAALYALSAPFSKTLLNDIQPVMMASLLYLGAMIGASFCGIVGGRSDDRGGALMRTDVPYVIAMAVLDTIAPILMMTGLTSTSAAGASLLSNFEIVTTALLAFLIFREHISPRMWAAIAVITAATAVLSLDGADYIGFSTGSLLIVGACLCWGLENNCTRALSERDPLLIVGIKGLFSGTASLVIAIALGMASAPLWAVVCALILGAISYGGSIALYIRAQRKLGAARTSAFYAVSPFIGAALSFAMYGVGITPMFAIALALMVIGTVMAVRDELDSNVPESEK